jgi:hypothetical protein
MSLLQRLSHSNFFIKLTHWEYWPFGIVQGPFFLYWLWLSLKARSLFFFSASNPSILMGGMMGESKFDVLKLVPEEVKPKTILISVPATAQTVIERMRTNGLSFPVVFKPDLGERGWMVDRIDNEEEAKDYLSRIKIDFLIQELVALPLEFGVFYVRMPDQESGKVVSITAKEFLSVMGDGKKTLAELIQFKDRAKLQWSTLRIRFANELSHVPHRGEKIELGAIGNHCLGTTFLNGNNLITPQLNKSFDRISKQVNGFYFGRYDLRCASIEDLENGKVKVVELNGCGAEPAHIYHPGASLVDALRVLCVHWRTMYRISKLNHERGVPYLSFIEGRSIFKKFKKMQRIGASQ